MSNDIVINSFPFNPLITNGSSVVFRRPKIAIPDETFNYRQMSDLFFWTWLFKKKDFIFLNKKLNNFRRHPESTTTKISLNQQEVLFKESIVYLNLYPDAAKSDVFFKKFISEFWWPNFKRGMFTLDLVKDLKYYNFFTLRIKFTKYLLRFLFSKI